MTTQARDIYSALQSVLPQTTTLHEPRFEGNEWTYVKECLDTGWVSSVGKFVDQFEIKLAEFTGVRYAVATVNGTAALHICLRLSGVTAGDEVLMPALTFVATANAVHYCGAFPHFIDSEEKYLGIDVLKLDRYLSEVADVRADGTYNRKTGRRIRALVPMHTFGHPVDLDAIVELCQRYKLELIEDAAESLGSFYKGRHTGNWAKLSALSFNGNKIVTTGGGGAILTNDEKLAKLAKHVTTTAKIPHKWEFRHDQVGFNYRLPNINAALGCAQLEKLPEYLEKKRKLADRYRKLFAGWPDVRFVEEPSYGRSNYWLNVIALSESCSDQLAPLLAMTNENKMMTRPAWTLMHRLKLFESCPKMDLSGAESLERRLLCIPSSPFLADFNS